jgi:hypothetical protein
MQNQPVTADQIIAALKSITEAAADLRFDKTPGGPSPWLKERRPLGHFWGDVSKITAKQTSNSGTASVYTVRRSALVVIEGWYPFSWELRSDRTWRNMLDAVLDRLEEQRTLGLGLLLEKGPLVVADGTEMHTSLHQGDQPVKCHYARLTARWVEEYEAASLEGYTAP